MYIKTPIPDTNRYVHTHKCLYCAEIEPATYCVVGEHTEHYTKSKSNGAK
jgi:hypothetical protein